MNVMMMYEHCMCNVLQLSAQHMYTKSGLEINFNYRQDFNSFCPVNICLRKAIMNDPTTMSFVKKSGSYNNIILNYVQVRVCHSLIDSDSIIKTDEVKDFVQTIKYSDLRSV